MTREERELNNKIQNKKEEIRNMIEKGDYDNVPKAKEELIKMSNAFNTLADISADEADRIQNKPDNQLNFLQESRHETPEGKFASDIKNIAAGRIVNTLNTGTGSAGGYTVPEDIETKVRKLRESRFSLRQLVSVVSVSAPTGQRTYQKRAAKNGFMTVAEAAAVPKTDEPEFVRIKYEVEKRSGYLQITDELLEDSDENITGIIIDWLADSSRVTANRLILGKLKTGTPTTITGLDDIKTILNVTLGSLFKYTSAIITNDNGIDWIDKLKDSTGRPLLQPNVTEPNKMQINCGGTVVRIVSVPNKDLPNSNDDKIPFIIGDLKEGLIYFEKKGFVIETSKEATVGGVNGFENGLMFFKGTEREDIQIIDDKAYVYAELDTSGN